MKQIKVTGSAEARSKSQYDSTKSDRLTGNELLIDLINDSTRIALVTGNAQGEYYVWDDEHNLQGVNLSAADVIEITLVSDRATRIKLQGGTVGAFHPPHMLPDPEKSRR